MAPAKGVPEMAVACPEVRGWRILGRTAEQAPAEKAPIDLPVSTFIRGLFHEIGTRIDLNLPAP